MKIFKFAFVIGGAVFLIDLVFGLITISLMGAKVIEMGPPPAFLFYGLIVSITLLACGGIPFLIKILLDD